MEKLAVGCLGINFHMERLAVSFLVFLVFFLMLAKFVLVGNCFRFGLPHQSIMYLDAQEELLKFEQCFRQEFHSRSSMVASSALQKYIFDDVFVNR